MATPRRLHPASPLLDVGRTAIFLLIISAGRPTALVLLVLVAATIAALRYLAWARFTYVIDGDSLVTEGGIVNRTRRVVPLDRIQQVDLQRKLRHQLFGLAVVRVDTAGGGSEPEVTLDAVTVAEAEALRAVLTDRSPAGPGDAAATAEAARADGVSSSAPVPAGGPAPAPAAAAPPEERELLRIDALRLAVGGVTGSKLAVVFVAVGAVVGILDDLPGALREGATDRITGSTSSGLVAVAVVAVLAVPVVLLAAAAAAVLTDGGYRLTRRGDLLHVSRGLLDQRQASLAVHRVQAVRIRQNPLRRVLGLASVTIQSAGGSGQVEQQDSRVNVPVMALDDVEGLLGSVLPDAPGLPALHSAPPAARRRAWIRRLVPVLLLALVLGSWVPPWGWLSLGLLPVAALGGELAYRGLGWARVGDHVVARRGALTRETTIVPVAKVQSTRLSTSPLQRRAGLATLHVDVAGRGTTPVVYDGAGEAMARLHRETSETGAARRDERAVRLRTASAAASEVAAAPEGVR